MAEKRTEGRFLRAGDRIVRCWPDGFREDSFLVRRIEWVTGIFGEDLMEVHGGEHNGVIAVRPGEMITYTRDYFK